MAARSCSCTARPPITPAGARSCPCSSRTAPWFALDRRGRGASGDAADYAVEREFEDVAAVVDAVAAALGSLVDLLGHSFGGFCALGAATLTSHLRKLVLYEPVDPQPEAFPADLLQRIEALLDEGNREALLETFLREAVMMPEHEFEVFRTLPAWQARIAAAHTLPRELRVVFGDDGFDLARAATITVPTLMLLGGDSPAAVHRETETVAAALPDARIMVLEGQQHVAIDTAPELFARTWWRSCTMRPDRKTHPCPTQAA